MLRGQIIEKINAFHKKYGLLPNLLICSKEEYQNLCKNTNITGLYISFPLIADTSIYVNEVQELKGIPEIQKQSIDLKIKIVELTVGWMVGFD